MTDDPIIDRYCTSNTDKALQAKNLCVALRGANLCIHFAGRLVRESPDRLYECALYFSNHNLLIKLQYLVS